MKSLLKDKKIWLFIGIILVIAILNHRFAWSKSLADVGTMEAMKSMVAANLPMAVALYIVITIIGSVLLALPGVTFAIIAGLLFGPVLGTVCCAVAATLGAMAAFLAGRFFLRDSIGPMAARNKYLNKWLFEESDKNAIFVLMITRLVPLFPYNLQNFAYGVTDIRFSTYSICTFIFMIPGTAMYTIGTAGLADRENRILYIGIAILLAVLVFGVSKFLKTRFVKD